MSCSQGRLVEQNVIIVKIPPIYDKNLTEEENYWRFRHFLFPQEEIPNPVPKGLPNDDSLLYVSLDENGRLKINSQGVGDVSETEFLTERLAVIFKERENNKVYESESQKIVKAVGIKAADSICYGDFVKVIEAVKQSGAEPIVLLFNNDSTLKVKTFHSIE